MFTSVHLTLASLSSPSQWSSRSASVTATNAPVKVVRDSFVQRDTVKRTMDGCVLCFMQLRYADHLARRRMHFSIVQNAIFESERCPSPFRIRTANSEQSPTVHKPLDYHNPQAEQRLGFCSIC